MVVQSDVLILEISCCCSRRTRGVCASINQSINSCLSFVYSCIFGFEFAFFHFFNFIFSCATILNVYEQAIHGLNAINCNIHFVHKTRHLLVKMMKFVHGNVLDAYIETKWSM